ncbi:hypothetical protein CPLU01_13035 [Colletotrichum plurivorum]|uniref:Uncharacterized protein n=1 Tax=Colletotrichum plurivorum TaxID=2175906 RepID=A0A8H6JVF0_9PEZI|nr:hypothetical protein CPLU01_13035 [Colletotrichum plurivorum]
MSTDIPKAVALHHPSCPDTVPIKGFGRKRTMSRFTRTKPGVSDRYLHLRLPTSMSFLKGDGALAGPDLPVPDHEAMSHPAAVGYRFLVRSRQRDPTDRRQMSLLVVHNWTPTPRKVALDLSSWNAELRQVLAAEAGDSIKSETHQRSHAL